MVSTRKCNGVVVVFLFLCSILCGMGFFDAPVHASSSISLSLNNTTLGLDLSPHGDNGAFAKSNNMTIDVVLSGPGGYTVGIQSSGATDLVKQGDSSKKLESITTSVSEADFSANTSTAATNYNGKWGYLPNKYDSVANTTFRPAPSSEGDVFDVTHGTNDEGTYTIALGARGDLSLEVGTYTNTFVITAVSNYSCSVGEICYFDNEADGGVMENQSIPQDASEIELVGDNYYKKGYGFAGWSETLLDPDDSNFFSDFEAATVYGPMETVTIPNTRYMELYAVWVPSQGNLQGWNGCSSMSTGEVTALTDTRDGNAYAIAKLADGQCWIIENLRLDFSDENVEITNLNTNHPTAQFTSDANKHPGKVTKIDSGNFDTTIQHLADPNQNYAIGNYYNYYTFRAGNDRVASSEPKTKGDICPAGWQIPNSYTSLTGILDNDKVAALMSFPNNFVKAGYRMINSSNSTNQFFYAEAKWSYGNSMSQYYIYGMFKHGDTFYPDWSYTIEPNRYGFVFRCVLADSETYTLSYDANGGINAPASETNNNGLFENITINEPTRSGYTFVGWIDLGGVEVQPGDDYNAGVGNTNATLYAMWKNNTCNDSATTIGTGTPTDAVCMQDMNGAVKNAMSNANISAGSIQTFQLIDARDNQSYNIALLDDGNVWMTKNLNFGGSTSSVLSHTDTNLTYSSFQLEAANTSTDYYKGETNDGYYNGSYYGGYYEWKVATASRDSYRSSTNRSTSICPSNWTLPTSSHYTILMSEASLTNYTSASVAPYSFNNGGYLSIGSANYSFYEQGTNGYYWTSTMDFDNNGNSFANDFYLASSSASIQVQANILRARSVRCIAETGTITLHYNGNDSATYPVLGSMPDQTVSNDTGNVSKNNFTRFGYVFNGWNTKADGTGTDVAVDTSVYLLNLHNGDEITLYAQWTPQVVITYNDNYSNTTSEVTVNQGNSTTIKNIYGFTTKPGYSIKEWNTEPDGSGTTYVVSSTYTAPTNLSEPLLITLYAQWIKDCDITFVNTISGETQTKSLNWNQSGTVTTSTIWTYSGYKIVGWDVVTNSGINGNGTVVYANNQSIILTSDLTIYTVWKPYYSIQYDGNGASSDTSMSITHEIIEAGEITLYASNYKRSGYGFAGWSFDPNAANNMSSATIYGPNATITVPAVTTPGEMKTLYAVWIPAESGITMQTFDGTGAPYASYQNGKVIALTDSRNNDTYAIAKLADGKWWMIENLRLGGSSSINLTNSDTAITSASLTFYGSTTSMSNTSIGMNATNTISPSSPMSEINANVLSYGNYYSWAAAVLSTASNVNTTVTTSVCPYGWHLPSGTGSGEFANLSSNLGGLTTSMNANTTPTGSEASKIWRAFPNNFIYSGYFYNRNSAYRGSYGDYWSATSYDKNNAYYFSINNIGLGPANSYQTRNYGLSIRCIAN